MELVGAILSCSGSKALCKVCEAQGIAILDGHMGRIEELKEDIGYADPFKCLSECFCSQVEEDIIALACIDVDSLHHPQIRSVKHYHAYWVPGHPSLPHFWNQLSRFDIV